jgi:glucose/arabinose dehydrogenase
MHRRICILAAVAVVIVVPNAAPQNAAPAQQTSDVVAGGLNYPASLVVGPDRKIYVAVQGERGKPGDGGVVVLDKGKATALATGMDEPRGLGAHQKWIYATDKNRVWRVDLKGKAEILADAGAFPAPVHSLSDLTVDPESGLIYVSDTGANGKDGAIYRLSPKGKAALVTDAMRWPGLHTPTGIVLDGQSHLLAIDAGTGELHRVRLADGTTEKIASGLQGGQGLAWDWFGRLYISTRSGLFVIPRPGDGPVKMTATFESAADICLDPSGKSILVADSKAGSVRAVRTTVPGAEVDETPLPLETAVAFPDLKWTGWNPETASGKLVPLRPILLTHAGDGSNRVFVPTQHGVIHVFPNDQKAKATKVFLDISERVVYSDNQNEEGFLGLAFHPKYKEKGEFFVFYTTKKEKMTNVLSRFRVSKDDPDRADPDSEEVILRIKRPFWNHDGGTIIFGPDGMLYLTLGDGGAANDPFNNGQSLKSWLGKIHRIDIDRKDEDKPYAVPKDNPFVDRPDARPETWAWGLRNIWRMAFDKKTGKLWAADVGQNLYEEINIIEKGGNYGWKLREGLHPFSPKGTGPRKDLIEPIWEYHHRVGLSITGGTVYRGKRLPELDGAYLYADYVTGKIWALRYDEAKKRVVANQPIRDKNLPIMSFGEDENGEVYLMTYSVSGRGLFWFVRAGEKGGRSQ